MSSTRTTTAPALHLTPFPQPGELIRLAYRDLDIAATADLEQTRLLGAIDALPRPWNPPSCTHPRLQAELTDWLGRVVGWINQEMCWQPADMVPGCWHDHPSLVLELALVADRRRAAEAALTSELMEDWHHTCVPALLARVRTDAASCVTRHQDWPGRARHDRHSAYGPG